MKNKVFLLAPDKFKFSMSAAEFCEIAEQCINCIFPNAVVLKCPLADGGEGSLDCFVANTGAKLIGGNYTNANFQTVFANYALNNDTAFIECSATAGLANTSLKNPCKTTTYGVGEQIKNALSNGAKTIYLGLGGSATNDAGCGMAAALGFEFRDKNNTKFIPTGDTLCKIASITAPKEQINAKIIVLCDVDNVLFGKNGAAYVYARQKGANDEQIKVLDNNLRYFNDLTKQNGVDFSQYKGSGAAGGLAAGAIYFLNATLQSGINTFFELTNIREKISKADFVITGEGKIDRQSMHGKVVFELHKICESKKFVAFCGTNELDFSPFPIISINKPNTPLSQSILDTKQNFTNALTQYLICWHQIKKHS